MVLEALIANFIGQEKSTIGISGGEVGVGEVGVDNSSFQVQNQVVGRVGQRISQLLAALEEGAPKGLLFD